MAGWHLKIDLLKDVLPGLISETHAFETDCSLKDGRRSGAGEIAHLGCLVQEVDHPLSCRGGFRQAGGVFGEVLDRPEAVSEIGHKNNQVARREFTSQDEMSAIPQYQRGRSGNEKRHSASECRRQPRALDVLFEACFVAAD